MTEAELEEESADSAKPPAKRNLRKRFLHWLWDAGETVPSDGWRKVRKSLKANNESPELTEEEKKVATIAFLDDEPSRNNRMGGVLTGVGGAVAAGGVIPALITSDPPGLVFVSVFGLAFVITGQGLKLIGMQREGIGPMVAAVLKHRYKL